MSQEPSLDKILADVKKTIDELVKTVNEADQALRKSLEELKKASEEASRALSSINLPPPPSQPSAPSQRGRQKPSQARGPRPLKELQK